MSTEYRIRPGNPDRLGVTRTGRGINFAVVVRDGMECSLILYRKGAEKPETELPFSEEMRYGDICAMEVMISSAEEHEYNYRINGRVVTDPYAMRVSGREVWGHTAAGEHAVRGVSCFEKFFWQGDRPLALPYEECVLYVTHPRGFTMDASSKARHPGTFAGIREKIPYLKKLGITQLELMPVYEFDEMASEENTKKHMPVRRGSHEKVNYWGYGKACYFAPKASYSASGNPVRELKELVRELHKNGIELILEFYFPKRTDPGLILQCIRYWVREYHIDGVHLNRFGTPLPALALEPSLGKTKIMSEGFPLDEIYEDSYEPVFRKLAEYNDDFLVKIRRFLRGDESALGDLTAELRRNPVQQATVNYVAGHNGFTLMDAVSYEVKHNEANGEENRDGTSYNYSCGYGEEGPAVSRSIEKLRRRQIRNALLLTFLSQGVPALYGGDEMGNSQQGNNNVYCQDNELSWIQWSRKKADRELTRFVQELIAFRKTHPAFGRRDEYRMRDYLSLGLPDLSFHGKAAWYGDFENDSRRVGILYAGAYTGGETLYLVCNMHTTDQFLALPSLAEGERWKVIVDTGREGGVYFNAEGENLPEDQKQICVPRRTIMILAGKKNEAD